MRFKDLPVYNRREFVADNVDLNDFNAVKFYFDDILSREVTSRQDFEKWLKDKSELESVIDQHEAVLYIEMTCQTDDEKKSGAYKFFVEEISSKLKLLDCNIDKKYLELADVFAPADSRYHIYTRAVSTDIGLFNEKNIDLETELDLLSQEYQTLYGGITIEYDGKTLTLPQAGKFLQEPDRDVRYKLWRLKADKLLSMSEKFDELFNKMFILRDKISRNAGFDNYRDYRFKELHRFDYSPSDCKTYHDSIEEVMVPIWIEILENRKRCLKLDVLRPWDLSVDITLKPPLKPFGTASELVLKCNKIFHKIDKDLGEQFELMIKHNLLDLESRKGKAPGGYQQTLNENRLPFVFMNAVGRDYDVQTLLHEGGHSFHSFACRNILLPYYRHAPMEFCEVASMGMELLGSGFLSEFYDSQDVVRSQRAHLEDIVFVLVWSATIDAFQHWIYENPGHTPADRNNAWLGIRRRFNGDLVDWSGLELEHSCLWHNQLHIFEVPFYYIEYGIAQLGALQLFRNAKHDFDVTVAAYKRALALGGSVGLPQLFEAASIKFDFSKDMIRTLAEFIRPQLQCLRG